MRFSKILGKLSSDNNMKQNLHNYVTNFLKMRLSKKQNEIYQHFKMSFRNFHFKQISQYDWKYKLKVANFYQQNFLLKNNYVKLRLNQNLEAQQQSGENLFKFDLTKTLKSKQKGKQKNIDYLISRNLPFIGIQNYDDCKYKTSEDLQQRYEQEKDNYNPGMKQINRKNIQGGISLLMKDLGIRQHIFGDHSIETTAIKIDLLNIYLTCTDDQVPDRYQKLKDIYEQILPIIQENLEIFSNIRLDQLYMKFGQIEIEYGNYDNALNRFNTVLQVRELYPSKMLVGIDSKSDNDFVSLVYNNIGISFLQLQNVQEAKEYFLKSINLAQNTSAYNNLGILNKLNQQYDEAIEYFTKGLELTKAIEKPQLQDLVTLCRFHLQLGQTLRDQKNFEEGIKHLEQGYILLERIHRQDFERNSEVANLTYEMGILNNFLRKFNMLGNLYFKMKQYENAINSFSHSLQISKNVNGYFHPQNAKLFDIIGVCYTYLGEPDTAISSFEKGLQIFHKEKEQDKLSIANIYSNMGYTLMKKDPQKALNYHNLCLEFRRDALKNSSEQKQYQEEISKLTPEEIENLKQQLESQIKLQREKKQRSESQEEDIKSVREEEQIEKVKFPVEHKLIEEAKVAIQICQQILMSQNKTKTPLTEDQQQKIEEYFQTQEQDDAQELLGQEQNETIKNKDEIL